MSHNFPARAFLQKFSNGRLPPESSLVAEELKARSIPFSAHTTEEVLARPLPLTKMDLVVGDFEWTRNSLEQLGLKMPEAPDYPECLEHLLHRKMWETTLGELKATLESSPEGTEIFIKPAVETKAFSGLVASSAWLEYLLEQQSPKLRIHCSEIVKFISEFRVYVVHGSIRAICRYSGKQEDVESHPLDESVVREAVRLLAESDPILTSGCGLDFGVIEKQNGQFLTALIEVNEGFSLGAYDGVSSADYTNMVIARWESLMK
jgi:hypothetical protein